MRLITDIKIVQREEAVTAGTGSQIFVTVRKFVTIQIFRNEVVAESSAFPMLFPGNITTTGPHEVEEITLGPF